MYGRETLYTTNCIFKTIQILRLFVTCLHCPPVSHRAGLSLSVAYRLNQSSSGSLQTELALAQSPLEVSTPLLSVFFICSPFLLFSLLLALILLSVTHLIVLLSFCLSDIHSHFSVHTISISGLLFLPENNSWLLHLLDISLVAAKLLHIYAWITWHRNNIHTDQPVQPTLLVLARLCNVSLSCLWSQLQFWEVLCLQAGDSSLKIRLLQTVGLLTYFTHTIQSAVWTLDAVIHMLCSWHSPALSNN